VTLEPNDIEAVKKTLCAICGVSAATTKDHIPPRGIFPRPRTHDLITVPACRPCNHKISKTEEEFRVYLSLAVGFDGDAASKLWSKEALPTLSRNKRLAWGLRKSMRSVLVTTPAGIILGERTAGHWPASAHDPVIEKMIRGLYFHHFAEILGDRVIINVQYQRKLNADMLQLCAEMPIGGRLADGAFEYRCARAKESPLHSIWIFAFY